MTSSSERERDAWIARDATAAPARRLSLLRSARRGGAVTLGADGRPVEGLDLMESEGTPEERAEAAGIVERARARADGLVQEARQEAVAIAEEAYQRGLEQGLLEGAAAARAELAEALVLVQQAAEEARRMRADLHANAEAELIELVIAATAAVIGERLEVDRDLVTETVRRALERAGAQNVVRVRVHHEEVDRVQAWFTERREEVTPFEVVGDAAIAIGGCIVDTAAGLVDARLDVELEEIARLLRDATPPEARDVIRLVQPLKDEEAA